MSTTSELRKGWFRYALTQCRDNSIVAMTDDEITAEWGLVRAERLDELERENAALKAALKPFAEMCGELGASVRDETVFSAQTNSSDTPFGSASSSDLVLFRPFTMGDIRRAAALAGSGEK
jgi:hypothetical protein